MSIRIKELKMLFERISSFGREENGGITRLSWSPSFLEAQRFLENYMKEIGLQTRIDAFGNLMGTRPGKEERPPVFCGSHLDSVPNGGAFDGALGIIAALEVMRSWQEEGFDPLRPVTVVAFAEEEGTLFNGHACMGSRFLTGELDLQARDIFRTASGTSLRELVSCYPAQSPDFFPLEPINRGSAYIELHIEQGNLLEEKGLQAGIVTTIVGIRHFTLLIKGRANHAGTTAMHRRQDAMVAAASLITFIYQRAKSADNTYVATNGRIEASPNAENVVAGEVRLSVEIRAERMEIIERVFDEIRNQISCVEQEFVVTVSVCGKNDLLPVPMDESLIRIMEKCAGETGLPYLKMPSWAGHDAMIMARHMPTAMLFVPSIEGISHAPEERSRFEDIEQAAILLDKTLRTLVCAGV